MLGAARCTKWVNGQEVEGILLNTGCSRRMVRRELVPEGKLLEGELLEGEAVTVGPLVNSCRRPHPWPNS